MPRRLILPGGGVKGFVIIGALRELERTGVLADIHTFVGLSIGSVLAALLAIGYTAEEIEHMFLTTKIDDIYTRSTLQLFYTYGMDTGNKIKAWLRRAFESKGYIPDLTFAQLAQDTGKHLYIGVSCLSTMSFELFSDEHEQDCKIIDAIYMSVTVPLFFSPMSYKNKIYIDGGMTCILPTNHFPADGETLALYLFCEKSEETNITSLVTFLTSVVEMLLNQLTQNDWIKTAIRARDDIITINIENNLGVLADIDNTCRKTLLELGQRAVREQRI